MVDRDSDLRKKRAGSTPEMSPLPPDKTTLPSPARITSRPKKLCPTASARSETMERWATAESCACSATWEGKRSGRETKRSATSRANTLSAGQGRRKEYTIYDLRYTIYASV